MLCLSGFELYSRWVPLIAKLSLTGFNRCTKTPNNTQQRKRTQHVTSNIVGSCWPKMLRLFAWPGKNTYYCTAATQLYR